MPTNKKEHSMTRKHTQTATTIKLQAQDSAVVFRHNPKDDTISVELLTPHFEPNEAVNGAAIQAVMLAMLFSGQKEVQPIVDQLAALVNGYFEKTSEGNHNQ
jgi:hypothetical protein